jgi:hypothetical protein
LFCTIHHNNRCSHFNFVLRLLDMWVELQSNKSIESRSIEWYKLFMNRNRSIEWIEVSWILKVI